MLSQAAQSGADIVVPTTREHQYEPLFAVYRKSALNAINKTLLSGRRKIAEAFALCKVESIELGTDLVNLNTLPEYEKYSRYLDSQL